MDGCQMAVDRFHFGVKTCSRLLQGMVFIKLFDAGKAYCIVCRCELNYSNRGVVVFSKHANSEWHQQNVRSGTSNTTLPGKRILTCWLCLSDKNYLVDL